MFVSGISRFINALLREINKTVFLKSERIFIEKNLKMSEYYVALQARFFDDYIWIKWGWYMKNNNTQIEIYVSNSPRYFDTFLHQHHTMGYHPNGWLIILLCFREFRVRIEKIYVDGIGLGIRLLGGESEICQGKTIN